MTEIAKLTGVSQPTVSRVLNGSQSVNPQIRERVLKCAREHDFQPNSIAQSLVGSKTHLIGVLVTDISYSFFADLVKYTGEEAEKEGYSLILFNSNYDRKHERYCLNVLRKYRVDGLIIVPVEEKSPEWKRMIDRLDMPTVVITRKAEGLDCVYLDHVEAGRQVGRHLLEEDCNNYVFFGNPTSRKYQGFLESLIEQEIDIDKNLTIITSKDRELINSSLTEHFEKHPERTGIFAYNDKRAFQIMGILQQMGVLIPQRAGLVGFDNTYICDYLYPKLSSVAQPNREMAELAIHRLLYKINHPQDKKVEDKPLKAELKCRGSSVWKG